MPKKYKKSDRVEMEKRINETIELILDGLSRYEIHQYGTEKWHVEPRAIDEYRRRATLILLKRSKASRAVKICKAEARYTRWLKKAEAENDKRFAAEMQDRLVSLGGLAAPNKLAVTDIEGKNDLVSLTEAEIKRRIEAVFEQSGTPENNRLKCRIPKDVSE